MNVGYLWQIEEAILNEGTSALHIKAVVDGLQKRGHDVRFVTTPEGVISYSDNWKDYFIH